MGALVTETSIMFMTTIPATIRATELTGTIATAIIPVSRSRKLRLASGVRMSKLSSVFGRRLRRMRIAT